MSKLEEVADELCERTSWSRPIGSTEHLDDDSIRDRRGRREPGPLRRWTHPRRDRLRLARRPRRTRSSRDFLGAEDFGALMGSRGISDEHTVVLYGDRNNWFAAYTYWYFRYYGHEQGEAGQRATREVDRRVPRDRTEVPDYPAATFSAEQATTVDPRLPRRGDRGARFCDQPGRRAQPAGVLRRADRDARLRAGGRPARRPHSRRRLGAVGAGRQRGRHLQSAESCVSSTPARA